MGRNLLNKFLVFMLSFLLIIGVNQPVQTTYPGDFPPDIEGDHYPCGVEYWWLYTMLTLENGSQWDMCAQFFYVTNWTGSEWSDAEGISYLRIQSWNRNTGSYYDCFDESSHPGKLQHEKNMVDLTYENTTMKGLYPTYSAYFDDSIHHIILDVNVHAISKPYQHLHSIVNGTIPLGAGVFSYWSIPLVEIQGTITINNVTQNVTGVGYHEHLFGDRPVDGTFNFRFSSIKDMIHLHFLYLSILKWMLQPKTMSWYYKMQRPHISVDNLRGYDWIWSAFDNGWSMILVRLRFGYPFSFTEGPSYSILIVTDGQHYYEFNEVYLKITEDVWLEEYGIAVPLDYKILALKDDKKILISFNSTSDFTQLHNKFTQLKSSSGGLFLAAGDTTGYFEQGEDITLLAGKGTNTPYIIYPILKYRFLEIQLRLPPDGFGFIINKITPRKGLKTFSFGIDGS